MGGVEDGIVRAGLAEYLEYPLHRTALFGARVELPVGVCARSALAERVVRLGVDLLQPAYGGYVALALVDVLAPLEDDGADAHLDELQRGEEASGPRAHDDGGGLALHVGVVDGLKPVAGLLADVHLNLQPYLDVPLPRIYALPPDACGADGGLCYAQAAGCCTAYAGLVGRVARRECEKCGVHDAILFMRASGCPVGYAMLFVVSDKCPAAASARDFVFGKCSAAGGMRNIVFDKCPVAGVMGNVLSEGILAEGHIILPRLPGPPGLCVTPIIYMRVQGVGGGACGASLARKSRVVARKAHIGARKHNGERAGRGISRTVPSGRPPRGPLLRFLSHICSGLGRAC